MVRAVVHREGDRVLFEVSADAPEIEDLKDGQILRLDISSPKRGDVSDEEFMRIVDRVIDENREALEYLAK